MSVDGTPRFTLQEGARLGRELYGIEADAAPLPSERDQNFALKARDGRKFVLKIAQVGEDRRILEFQNAALRHVAAREPQLGVSRVLSSVSGEEIATIRDASGRSFLARLVTWVDGEIFVHAASHDDALLESLGVALARLDAAFADFQHPAMHRHLHWDLRHIGIALEHLPLLSARQREIVQHFKAEWERIEWKRLRTGVIHGDANDYNVLVRGGRVIGFLDFGDMVHSAVVCDLAIALAYVMLEKPDPVNAALKVTAAYHLRSPLQAQEIDALYPLALSRLCMSVCFAAYNARAKSGDAYQTVTAGPAWKLLHRLIELPIEEVRGRFRGVCAA